MADFNETTFICRKKNISKPREILGRKAIGPVKWQPVAEVDDHFCFCADFYVWSLIEGHFFIYGILKKERKTMKKYFKLLTTILFAACTISSYGAFMVTQTSFGVDLAKPVTEDTTLINQGNKPVRVRVDFEKPQWAKDEYYLGDQLVAYPRIVVIPH